MGAICPRTRWRRAKDPSRENTARPGLGNEITRIQWVLIPKRYLHTPRTVRPPLIRSPGKWGMGRSSEEAPDEDRSPSSGGSREPRGAPQVPLVRHGSTDCPA